MRASTWLWISPSEAGTDGVEGCGAGLGSGADAGWLGSIAARASRSPEDAGTCSRTSETGSPAASEASASRRARAASSSQAVVATRRRAVDACCPNVTSRLSTNARPSCWSVSTAPPTACSTRFSRTIWPSEADSGTATAAMKASTRATRSQGELNTRRRCVSGSRSTQAARPVPRSCVCHARAASMTSLRCIPISRKTPMPLSTMPARLAPNSSSAPEMMSVCQPVPMPKPAVPSGGMSATAMATPGMLAERRCSRDAVTTAPARPDAMAMARSSSVGRVRAAISGVISENGNSTVSSAARAITPTAPTTTVRPACSASRPSPTASAIDRPRRGPSRGATSIAPITTAVALSSRPSVAMAPESMSTDQNGRSVSAAASAVSRKSAGQS